MYGELIPVGGGDPIPLLKKGLLIGRRESCDIVLRFSNVSAHHCQLTVNAGYWHVRDLQSRNGVKVNGVRVTDKRVDPGDILSIAKHKYEVNYSPMDLGAVGPPPPDVADVDFFSKSLSGAGGFGAAEDQLDKNSVRTGRGRSLRHHQRRAGANPLSEPPDLGWAKRKKSAPTFAKTAASVPGPPTGRGKYQEHGFKDEAPLQGERISGKGDLVRRRTICGEQARRTRRARLRRATRRGRERLPSRTGVERVRAGQHGRGRDRLRLPMLHAAAAENACHRATPRRGRRRPRRVSPVGEDADPRGRLHRAGRAAPRLHLPSGSRPAANPGRQRRSVGHRLQRAEPRLKPHLIDRMLVAAEKGGVRPLICINKVDLVDPAGCNRWSACTRRWATRCC